jgi:glycosyltransferase involved in cell wall biosynthesis
LLYHDAKLQARDRRWCSTRNPGAVERILATLPADAQAAAAFSFAATAHGLRARCLLAHGLGNAAMAAFVASEILARPLVLVLEAGDLRPGTRPERCAGMVSRASCVVVDSPATAERYRELFADTAGVPLVAAPAACPRPSGAASATSIFACIGPLVPERDLCTVVAGARRAIERHAAIGIVFLGEADYAHLDSLAAREALQADIRDLAPRVTLVSGSAPRQVEDLLVRTRGLIELAADSVEPGFPFAVAKALACRVPVIATETPGLRAAVGDQAGILLPPADPSALAEALVALTDPARHAALARGSQQRAREAAGQRQQLIDRLIDLCAGKTAHRGDD